MTKKQMIQTIQQQEAALYYILTRYRQAYGDDDNLTNNARSKWISVYNLMKQLDVAQDHSLHDNQKAAAIIGNMKGIYV